MKNKHLIEREALIKKIDSTLLDQEKTRRKDQERMLQKFINVNNELKLQQ
jgi:hypothetical protein